MPEALDPLNLPLHGSQLIEASAGTGKTWTIAALYLRLVLGHGGEGHGFARTLVPAEILVMTFTKAATRELSDRIRNRLVEAACCFRGEAEPRPDDTFLANLLQAYPEGLLREAAAWRLAMAAEAMDDAAVYTIDAWCQRMLHEHAFDSGCLFDEELEANEGAMLAEAARDYWRQEIYPLSDAALAIAMNQWKDVDALRKDVLPLIDMPLPPGAGQGSLEACMAGAGAQRARTLTALKSGWPARADAMLAWLEGQWSSKNCAIDKRVLARAHCTRWIQDLKSWALSEIAELPALGRGAQRLTRAAVLSAVQRGFVVDIPDAFEAFEALFVAFQSLPDPATALRAHAAARVAERMQHLKQQAGAFGFSDMLERLHEALDEATHGAQARRLRQRIVDQYPVALVDEFQDTSPVQLGIFDRLYRIADNDPVTALLLIGDPKQSIYGFRGADIYSYLGARRSTAGRHHALGTNHRSTEALVTAVNHLFRNAEQRPGAGAFLFRTDSQDGSLPFEEVAARGREQRLVTQAGQIPAITFVVDAALRGQPESRAVLAALCAERLVALLNDEGAGFAQEGKPFQRLQPADMAVLVRTGTEAHVLRQALHRRGVASVYLSDKDTVFKTQEALDLLRVLQAVAAPRDVRLARAALATALIGSTLEELLALSTEDALFDAQCELLQQLHVTWQTQGVLAMVRRALHGFGLPARLLGSGGSSAGVATDVPANGERRLTNVLHLAELLQAASAQAEGDQALIRWLAQQIEDSAAGLSAGDEQVLRLESDADLVKVVTVHKSKGLEYPLVFLPFAAHYRGVTRKNTAVVQRVDGAGRRWLVLSPSEEDLQADDKERQREDLRLLYVALTRARHALWVGVSALKEGQGTECVWHRSAIGYLLSGPQARLPAQIAEDLRAVASRCPEIRVEPHASIDGSPMPSITRMAPREAPPALVAA
ncbi:MAG: UvrD-helicase domain-containing protein, partial [Burkholderiaceae bacterium]